MKMTVEMTKDGDFRVDIEESTKTLFRGQDFEPLPGTTIIGSGFGRNLSIATLAAEDQFTRNAMVARNFYLEKKTA